MSQTIVISIAAAALGAFTLIRARRASFTALGALLVAISVGVLVWSRVSMTCPPTEPLETRIRDTSDKVDLFCEQALTRTALFAKAQEDVKFTTQVPWSMEQSGWQALSGVLMDAQELCFPDSDRACFVEMWSKWKYPDVKPELDRVIHAFETQTSPCPPKPRTQPPSGASPGRAP